MKVVVFSGHMIDRADRPQARFPASKAASAKERIQAQLDLWQISASDRVISSAACGSDILFLECCLDRQITPQVLLASPKEDFIQSSVAFAGPEWIRRFEQVCARSTVCILGQAFADQGLNVYARTNLWIVQKAENWIASSNAEGFALLVWNGVRRDQNPGGTAHFAQSVKENHWQISIINPETIGQ